MRWGLAKVLKDLRPTGPILTPGQRWQRFGVRRSAEVDYTSSASGPPVMPLQGFGAAYDLDLVLVSKHPRWNMHEYARIHSPQGPVWMCKDAEEGSLNQSIIADVDGLEAWLPEIPVVKRRGAVKVKENLTETSIEVSLQYQNFDGEAVEVYFEGPWPTGPQKHRNSSTMGHSREVLLAGLDVSHQGFARRASMTIDGKPVPLVRIAGLVPFKVSLIQTQAGLTTGQWTQRVMDGHVETTHAGGLVQRWVVEEEEAEVHLIQRDPLRTLTYVFDKVGEALELRCLKVEQFERSVPTATVLFNPSLPDVRRGFTGVARSEWVLDINGQESHARGQVEVRSESAGCELAILPIAPDWTCDRPMRARVTRGDVVEVQVERVQSPVSLT